MLSPAAVLKLPKLLAGVRSSAVFDCLIVASVVRDCDVDSDVCDAPKYVLAAAFRSLPGIITVPLTSTASSVNDCVLLLFSALNDSAPNPVSSFCLSTDLLSS